MANIAFNELALKGKVTHLLETKFSGEKIYYKEIIGIILPVLMDQSFVVMMSLLNVAMVSSAGVTAISAVNMVDSLNMLLISVYNAMATGGAAVIAQYKGSRNEVMVNKTATQNISLVASFSLIVFLLLITFHNQVLSFLFNGADKQVFQYARLYLIGSCISYPFLATYQGIYASLIGVGETKNSLKLSLTLNLTYTILNVLFIKILHMGVMGLVISVILARLIGMSVALTYIAKFNHSIHFRMKNAFKWDISIVKRIMFIAVPFALEQTFFNGGKLLTQTFIVKLGTMALAANAIAGTISSVYQIAPSALSIAMVTIVGQCIGQKRIEDARKLTKSFVALSSVVFISASLIIFPLFPILMKLFTAPEAIIPTIFYIVLISAFAQPIFWSLGFILPSALRAAGDAKFTSITSMLSMWFFRVVMGYGLGITFHFGIIGVWVAMFLEWGVRSFFFSMRFRGEEWYKHKLI